MAKVVHLVFLCAVTVLTNPTFGIPTTSPPVAPPAPWFPNRHPQVFQSGEKTTLYTTFMEMATFLTEDRTNFRFRVKACAEAVIIFYTATNGDTHDDVMLTLGAEGNRMTILSKGGQEITAQETPDILHCNEARAFWISWQTTLVLLLGHGPVVGQNIIMAGVFTPFTHYTAALILKSGLQTSSAVWEVMENSADELLFSAQGEAGYGMIWKDVYKRNFFTFHVTACYDAQIILTSQHGDVRNKVYEIVLGAELDQKSLIRTAVGGGLVLAEVYGGVLNCLQPRAFWISWFNHAGQFGTIKVGKGAKYGENVILDVHDPERPVDVRHLAVNSAFNVQALWGFEEDIEDTTFLRTQIPTANIGTPESLYKNVWLESVQSKFMTFFVTSCCKVAIHLSTTVGVDEEFGVELVVSNNNTILRDMISVDDLDSASTPDILAGDQMRYFWLSWRAGYIRFGRGRIPDQKVVVEAHAPSKTYYALSLTSYDKPALWAIKARSSENLQLMDTTDLPAPLNIWRTIVTKKEMTFQVKSCSDVTILLSPFPGSDSTSFYFRVRLNVAGSNLTIIDLVIGGSEGTAKKLASTEEPDLLSCDSFREFYIAWWEAKINVGRGRYQGRLRSSFIKAEHTSSAYHIQAASLRVPQGIAADWSIRGDVGDSFIYHTPPNGKYQNWITLLQGASYISFDITAGSDARILLVEDILELESKKLEVVISGWNNTQSVIRETGKDGQVYANVTHHVGLLDKQNSRTFWVSWDNHTGEIQVGGGNPLLDSGAFMSWQNPNPFEITAVAFMTGASSDGHWYVRQHMGKMTMFPTHVPIMLINGEETWRVVEHVRSLYFKVKAESEVSLTLAEHAGITKRDALKLVIGAANNTVTNIQTANGGKIFLQVDTPGILDAKKPLDFWVLWNDGEVQFGRGAHPGLQRVLNFQVIPVLNIRAVRFSTGFGMGEGQWSVQMWDSG